MPWRYRLRPRREEAQIELRDISQLLQLFFGSFSEDLTLVQRLRHFFLMCFTIAGGVLVGVALLKIAPWLLSWSYEPGDDILVNAIKFLGHVFWLFIRGLLLFCLPTLAIYKLLSTFPVARWIAYPVIALLAFWFLDGAFGFRANRAARLAVAESAKEAAQRAAEEQVLASAQERELGELAKRRADLAAEVDIRWRADVEAAGATGKPGVVPPMLKIKELRQQVQATNRTDKPLYLALARVARGADGSHERCDFDGGNRTTLGPHDSHRFTMYLSGNPPGCMNAPLEFRVGSATDAEPSWWSQSALEDFAVNTAPRESALHKSKDTLLAEITELERRRADPGRAERWRTALGTIR